MQSFYAVQPVVGRELTVEQALWQGGAGRKGALMLQAGLLGRQQAVSGGQQALDGALQGGGG